MSLCGCHLRSLDEIQTLSLSNIPFTEHDQSCFYHYVQEDEDFLAIHQTAFNTNVPFMEMTALLEDTTDEEFAHNLKSGYNPLLLSLLHPQNIITIQNIIQKKRRFLTARTKKVGTDVYNECALHLAVRTQSDENIIAMVAQGFISAIFMINSNGESPLHTALESSCSASTISLLISVMQNFPFENMMMLLLNETVKGETMLEIAIRKKYDHATIENLSWMTVKAARESGVNIAILKYQAGEPLQNHFAYEKHPTLKDCLNLTPTTMVKRRLRSVPISQARDINHFLVVIVKKTHSHLITRSIDKDTTLNYDIVLQTQQETEDIFERSVKFLENKWEKRLLRACLCSYVDDRYELVWAMRIMIEQFDSSFNLDTSCLEGISREQKEKLIDWSNEKLDVALSKESFDLLIELVKTASQDILNKNFDSIQKKKDIDANASRIALIETKRIESCKQYETAVKKADKAFKALIAQEESEKNSSNNKKKSRRNGKHKKGNVTAVPSSENIEYALNSQMNDEESPDFCNILPLDDLVAIEIKKTEVLSDDVGKSDPIKIPDLIDDAYQESECIICMENKKDTCFVPCGHVCVCATCAGKFSTEKLNLDFATKLFSNFM